MDHPLFKERTFRDACQSVVGPCNGFTYQERWEKETPDMVRAILKQTNVPSPRILDYGCGVGRLAREVTMQHSSATLVGIDESPVQQQHARDYVDSARFTACFPHEVEGSFDLVYCIYVLQHVPALDLRGAIARIHHRLNPDGMFVYCSSETRMAVRWDSFSFFDDRFLGVNVRAEIEKLFEPVGDLFDKDTLRANPLLHRMILGVDVGQDGIGVSPTALAHPAIVYKPRPFRGQYFDVPPITR
jgi:SAM-dependent methyltransferase